MKFYRPASGYLGTLEIHRDLDDLAKESLPLLLPTSSRTPMLAYPQGRALHWAERRTCEFLTHAVGVNSAKMLHSGALRYVSN